MWAELRAGGDALRSLMEVLGKSCMSCSSQSDNIPMKHLTNRSKQTKNPIINREHQCWASIIDAPKAYKRTSNDTLLKPAICKVL